MKRHDRKTRMQCAMETTLFPRGNKSCRVLIFLLFYIVCFLPKNRVLNLFLETWVCKHNLKM